MELRMALSLNGRLESTTPRLLNLELTGNLDPKPEMQRREKKPRTQQRIRGNKESTTGLLNEPRPLFLQEEGGGFTRKPQHGKRRNK
ncbi:hypothetical protein KCU74_g123, partial [Aureobasidium melanogenum]